MIYLKEHLNGYGKIPEKAWKAECDRKLAERYTHCDEYYFLKEDVRMVEVLRRGAEDMIRDIAPEQTPTRDKGIGR